MTSRYALLVIAALCLVACGKKDDKAGGDKAGGDKAGATASGKAPAKGPSFETASMDLIYEMDDQRFRATMDAPKGAKFEESYGTYEVKLGDGKDFFVQIETDAPDMAAIKADIEKNDVQKLVKFHTETADTFIYETKFASRTSFWLDTAVPFGEGKLTCRSGRGAHSYTKAHIEAFDKACKSLKPKP